MNLLRTCWMGLNLLAMINGSEALGGMSAAMEHYLETHDTIIVQEDLDLLSAAMELENGMNSDECLLLTGSVILNRAYYCEWAPDSIEEVILQKGQYAEHTVANLYTVKVSDRVRRLALHLLICGPKGPPDLIYQAMFPQGEFYRKVDTEYFGRGG